MILPGLALVMILTCSDANHANQANQDNHANHNYANSHEHDSCEDCVENGPWFPLFKPSQIISSELPEHEQYRSQEAPPPLTYATQRPQVSQESGSQECHDHAQVVELSSGEASGVNTPVRSYGGHGGHRVEWDHYGDVTTVATVVHNSLEDRGGGVPSEDRSDNLGVRGEQDSATSKSQESFFDNGSFFDEPSKETSPEDFEVSDLFSGEHHHYSNSIEYNSRENFGRAKTPVATSYASFSSVFESRPIARSRDLLHPDLSYNDIPHYIELDHRFRANKTKYRDPYFFESPGGPLSNFASGVPLARNKPLSGPLGLRPSSYVPLDHPVYKYVKVHGGLSHRPLQSRSTLRWEDLHPQLRTKFPFKYLRPRVHVQNHESFVNHVVPTKDPFSDSFWRESQKIEDLKPPPLGQTLFYYKKSPIPLEMKTARRRQSPSYMYIIRRNKKY